MLRRRESRAEGTVLAVITELRLVFVLVDADDNVCMQCTRSAEVQKREVASSGVGKQ
jgi:hypothetical protein